MEARGVVETKGSTGAIELISVHVIPAPYSEIGPCLHGAKEGDKSLT
jgi:hypothetical protein